MAKQVRLLHSTHRSTLAHVLQAGLRASSSFDDLGLDMRRGVLYCWLRIEDDKMSFGGQRSDYVYLEVTADEDRCMVADMEWSSMSLMYKQGQRVPQNLEAARLVAEL
jgi:hypothetical protein